MAKWKNTGIFETYFPKTLEELFLHSDFGGIPNFGAEIARCERRAWQVFNPQRKTFPKTVSVRLDNSRRPLSETQKRDEDREALENLMARDVRNKPIEREARDVLQAVDVFHRTLQLFQDDLKKITVSVSAEERAESREDAERRFRILVSVAMKIAALDKNIQVRPFEPHAVAGRQSGKWAKTGRREIVSRQKTTKREFLKLYEALRRNARGTEQSQWQIIENARKRFKEEHPEEHPGKPPEMKTPSLSTVYSWLGRSQKKTTE